MRTVAASLILFIILSPFYANGEDQGSDILFLPRDGRIIIEYNNKQLNLIELREILSNSSDSKVVELIKKYKRKSTTAIIFGGIAGGCYGSSLVCLLVAPDDGELKRRQTTAGAILGVGTIFFIVSALIGRSGSRNLSYAIEEFNDN